MNCRNLQRGGILLGILIGILATGGAIKLKNNFWGRGVGFFLKGVLNDGLSVGAVTPCSRYVARACTKYLAKHKEPKFVLEVGAGTGAITREIVRHINDGDQLDVVEIDQDYIQYLQKRFGKLRNVSIFSQDVSCWDTEKKYDFIISTVPFTSLPLDVVVKIIEKYEELIKPGGYIVYVEYNGVASTRESLLELGNRIRFSKKFHDWLTEFRAKRNLLRDLREKYCFESIRRIS